jgi:hypothetical protein
VVRDDGTAEDGYGWVASAIEGVYVQTFEPEEFPSGRLDRACICWMRSRDDATIDFEVVIFGDNHGVPLMEPAVAIPATAAAVPTALDGRFYEVDLGGVQLGRDTFHLGVRWDPSVDQYFYLCADKSEETPVAQGFFIDDRADEWASVVGNDDPTFFGHRAMFIRAVAEPGVAAASVPTMGTMGIVVFVVLMAIVAFLILGRREKESRAESEPVDRD